MRERLEGRERERERSSEKECERESGKQRGKAMRIRLTQELSLLPPSPCLRHSVPLMSQHTQLRLLVSLVLVGLPWLRSDLFSWFCVDSHLHVLYNRERNVNRIIFVIFIVFLRCV